MNLSERIYQEISCLNLALTNHRIYNHLKTLEDIKIFTQYHVFAVWDFMSLLKSLQRSLTCVDIPWKPNINSNTARFINEIVLGEETDIDKGGVFKSHFDMYIDAMKEIGSDTNQIIKFISCLKDNDSVAESLKEVKNTNIKSTQNLEDLAYQLKEINLRLWNIEDHKRKCEKDKDFSQTFINLAREVYINNDKRAKIKSEINKILDSNIREIKHYTDY